jgi:hypothetical protein
MMNLVKRKRYDVELGGSNMPYWPPKGERTEKRIKPKKKWATESRFSVAR